MQKLLTGVWIGFIVCMVLAFTFLIEAWWVSLPVIGFGLLATYLTTDFMGRNGYDITEIYRISHMQ